MYLNTRQQWWWIRCVIKYIKTEYFLFTSMWTDVSVPPVIRVRFVKSTTVIVFKSGFAKSLLAVLAPPPWIYLTGFIEYI